MGKCACPWSLSRSKARSSVCSTAQRPQAGRFHRIQSITYNYCTYIFLIQWICSKLITNNRNLYYKSTFQSLLNSRYGGNIIQIIVLFNTITLNAIFKSLQPHYRLNLLVAGCGDRDLHIFGYGVYPISVTSVPSQQDRQVCQIFDNDQVGKGCLE